MIKRAPRHRGKAYPPGVVREGILQFLLMTKRGEATEPAIRDHLQETHNVTDRKTIRNHLDYLDKKGIIRLSGKNGRENIWSVTESLVVPEYVFSEFFDDAFLAAYRSPFFQKHLRQWYKSRVTEIPGDGDAEREDDDKRPRTEGSPDQDTLLDKATWLSIDAVELSPTHYLGANPVEIQDASHLVRPLLMVMGKSAKSGEEMPISKAETVFARTVADLVIDFSRNPSTQDEILEFFKRPDFHQFFTQLFPVEMRRLLSSWMAALYTPREPITGDERKKLFNFDKQG